MAEPNRPLSADERSHLKTARELAPLIAHPGWAIYAKLIRAHLDQKTIEALAPNENVDQAMASNAAKGAVAAFKLCLDLPSGIIRVADDIRKQHGDANEIDDD